MYLFGASGHAKVIIEILENSKIEVRGLFDDKEEIVELFGYTCTPYSTKSNSEALLIISIGDNKIRKDVVKKIRHLNYGKAIDVNSIVSKRVTIKDGSVVMPGAIINSNTVIGMHCIINTNATVDHDCVISDFVHISPGVSLSGGVFVGEGTHIGTGSSIIPNVKIGKWCKIGAGSVIIKDVPDYAVVVGNPGRIIKYASL